MYSMTLEIVFGVLPAFAPVAILVGAVEEFQGAPLFWCKEKLALKLSGILDSELPRFVNPL